MGKRPYDTSEPWVWSPRKERAAELMAQGLTIKDVCAQTPVNRRTLTYWRTYSDFTARVEELKGEFLDDLRKQGILAREQRLRELDDLYARFKRLIAERGEAFAGDAPGGATGLIHRSIRSIGTGRNQQVIEEWEADVAVVREMRALMQQAAQELGEWAEKRELAGAGGGNLVVEYVNDWRPTPGANDAAPRVVDDQVDDDGDDDGDGDG